MRILASVIVWFCLTVAPSVLGAAVKPHLIALSVVSLDRSIDWYQLHFGFELTSKNQYPDYKLEIAMLELAGFRLELIQHGDSISPEAVLPDKANPATLQGIVKLAFWVDDVKGQAEDFRSANTVFKMDPSHDAESNTISFIVVDPDGNWIQLFGDADTTP